jgi:hypothetical protein
MVAYRRRIYKVITREWHPDYNSIERFWIFWCGHDDSLIALPGGKLSEERLIARKATYMVLLRAVWDGRMKSASHHPTELIYRLY